MPGWEWRNAISRRYAGVENRGDERERGTGLEVWGTLAAGGESVEGGSGWQTNTS